jgi:hypothetical protein
VQQFVEASTEKAEETVDVVWWTVLGAVMPVYQSFADDGFSSPIDDDCDENFLRELNV